MSCKAAYRMRAAVLCPDSRKHMLLPELAAAPTKRAVASVAVAYGNVIPNSKVASDPGVKKSMIRPITHGIVRFTPVEITKHPTPTVMSRHWGFARETSLRMEVTSGEASVLAGVLPVSEGSGEVISVTEGAFAGEEGDEGVEAGVGVGRGVSGLTDFASVTDELYRIDLEIVGGHRLHACCKKPREVEGGDDMYRRVLKTRLCEMPARKIGVILDGPA